MSAEATVQTAGHRPPRPQRPTGRALELALGAFDGQMGSARRIRRPRRAIYAVLLTVAGLMVWAQQAPVDRLVRTQGRVVPSVKAQLVQHLEGGIISQVLVQEGDKVQRGAPLVVVSDLMANATRDEKRKRQGALQARVARLRAEAEGARSFVPPQGLGADAAEVRNESEAFAARVAKLQQSTAVLREQAEQKRHEVDEQKAHRQGLEAEAAVARQQVALVTTMLQRKAASQQELLDAQARLQRLLTQIQEAESALPRLNAAVQELQARAAEVQAQFRSEARTGLSDAETELRRLKEDLKTDDDRVHRTVVTAPLSGTVNKLNANTVGGVVRPGEVLMELTPEDNTVTVETRASPADRGAMTVGQSARLRVSAFDYTSYGTLKARVTEISPDSLADERGERYFRVGLLVDAESLRDFSQPLTPGMTLSADIITGRRTVAQYLLSPIKGLASTAFRERR